jgi:WD40 repeat protein
MPVELERPASRTIARLALPLVVVAVLGFAALAIVIARTWLRATRPRRIECLFSPLSVAFSPTGELVAVSETGGLEVFSVATGAKLGGTNGGDNPVWALSFSPTGDRVAGAYFNGPCFVAPMPPARSDLGVAPVGSWGTAQYFVAFSPELPRIAVAGTGGVTIWSLPGGGLVAQLPHVGRAVGVAFSPSGRLLASAGSDGGVRIFDQGGEGAEHLLGNHGPEANCVSFSHDGTLLASAADDSSVKLWSVAGRTVVHTWQTPFRGCSVTFSSDDAVLVAAGNAGAAAWNVRDGTPFSLPTRDLHFQNWARAAFSPQDDTLALTDGTRLWLFPWRALGH